MKSALGKEVGETIGQAARDEAKKLLNNKNSRDVEGDWEDGVFVERSLKSSIGKEIGGAIGSAVGEETKKLLNNKDSRSVEEEEAGQDVEGEQEEEDSIFLERSLGGSVGEEISGTIGGAAGRKRRGC